MEKEPERKCIVTGEVGGKEDLLRFTLTPDGEVVPDLRKKLPGRGAYVSCSRASLEKAAAKKLFAKAFKQAVRVEPGLAGTVEALLRKAGLESLSLARKAGVLAAGFDKVCAELKAGKAALVVEAADALEGDGHRKISALAAAVGAGISAPYTIAELDGALGKDNTVHLALLKSAMAERAAADFHRLEKFIGMEKAGV